MKVLVTGGAGYIGSTICSALLDHGHTPVLLDSLITGREEFTRGRVFYKGDIGDREILNKIFSAHPDIECTIHCAALVVVPESVQNPYAYYNENVIKSLQLFNNLNANGCKNIVFSSSAAIYDDVAGFMVTEKSPLNPRSPYARTKFMMEMILKDFCAAYGMRGIALRYFNPIGAEPQMRTGNPIEFPSHVLGKLVDTARGKQPFFELTGIQWETRDGSGIRDYIHVWDLAMAHIYAVEKLDEIFKDPGTMNPAYKVINLGTGRGVTVRELIGAFERVYGKPVKVMEKPSRQGDIAGAYANADTAQNLLGWKAQLSIEKGIADALEWAGKRKSVLK